MADEEQVTDERVLASTLEVGDEVWIPNSRKPQEIDSITANAESISLQVGETTWVVKGDHEIRKVVK